MFGYMTASEALENGFTHHGKYFGVPIWVGDIDNTYGGLLVATKWAPLEYLLAPMHFIEAALSSRLYPDEPPSFQFWIGAPIDDTTPDVT